MSFKFEKAQVVRSNLGGMGGRCDNLTQCVELEAPNTPHEIYISRAAVRLDRAGLTDLRITNTSEYRARNSRINGIKRMMGAPDVNDGAPGYCMRPHSRRRWHSPAVLR